MPGVLASAIHMVGTPANTAGFLDLDVVDRRLDVEARAQEQLVALGQ